MQTRPWIPAMLRFDAMLNFGGAVIALALGGPLADSMGLGARWPLYGLAVLFTVNGAECLLTARDPRPGMLTVLAAVDFVFVAGVLAFAALADGADTWMRWALVVTADATIVTGAAKLIGRRARATASFT